MRALEKERVELAARLAPTVCAVFRGQGGGSGVIITKDGLVLSNFHVTGLDSEMRIGMNDRRIHPDLCADAGHEPVDHHRLADDDAGLGAAQHERGVWQDYSQIV